jgi:hypothetical protein
MSEQDISAKLNNNFQLGKMPANLQLLRYYFYGNVYSVTIAIAIRI